VTGSLVKPAGVIVTKKPTNLINKLVNSEKISIYFMFIFIIYHKLSIVEMVLGLMRAIWSKVLGFRIIS
jgi:hypothetical protein